MIVFLLDMPNRGSWNDKWSGEGRCYTRVYKDNKVPVELIGKTYYYRWDDGWTASITVQKIDANEAKYYRKNSVGFLGYDWMIESLITHGYITIEEDFIREHGTEEQIQILDLSKKLNKSANKDFTEIKDLWAGLKELNILIESGYIQEDTELFICGPTIHDIIKFMYKYKNAGYYIKTDIVGNQITFNSMHRNTYNASSERFDAKEELKKIMQNAPNQYKDGIEIIYEFK